ncbi:Retrovirus-related Pol polyprotein from transposon 412 [Araneus ventricosus]|uniref:RNA-directed DNA polymerase n=1 Tax=Araneus ventricosus TaxID=182803 RepID=A0A4Y2N676_ARAVE|nr:Retrovirus-related Pol polyprotein from transposon 412 [Araneus ventricosus]
MIVWILCGIMCSLLYLGYLLSRFLDERQAPAVSESTHDNLSSSPRRDVTFGGTQNESVEEYIRRIELEAAVSGIGSRATLRLAIAGLHDNAARWYAFMNFRLEELNWFSFKSCLREQYAGFASPLIGAERLLQMKYSVGEDFESFAWRFRDSYLEWRGNSSESEIAQALVDRLPEEQRLPLELLNFQSVREVIIYVNRRVSPSPVGRNRLQSSIFRLTHPIDRQTFVGEQGPSYPGLTRVRCFRCNELGHVARLCTQEKRQPGEMVLGIVNSPYTGSVEFLSPIVNLGGMEVRARIDTGADKSLLSHIFASSLLEQGRVSFSNQQINLCGVSGKKVQALGQVTGRFEWKGISRKHEFVVVRGLPVPMLMGVDLLQAWGAVVDFGKCETVTGTRTPQTRVREMHKRSQMLAANAFSRNPVEPAEKTQQPEYMIFEAQCVDLEEIWMEQQRDSWYRDIIVYLKKGELPIDPAVAAMVIGRSTRYRLKGDLLEYKHGVKDVWRLAVPAVLKTRIMAEFHEPPIAGHLGIKTTYKKCQARMFWPNMKRDIKEFVSSCQVCQKYKFSQNRRRGFLKNTTVSAPNEMMGIDLMGPLPVSTRGNRYCLVIVDYYSKWVELFPLRRATTVAIARCLARDVFSRFGCPRALLSDNGPQFVSDIYEEVCRLFGIRRKFASPYHPQTNLTECVNRTLGRMIASYVENKHGTWDRHLEALGFALRTTVSETTGQTPARLFLGREIALPWDTMVQQDIWTRAEEYSLLSDLVKAKVKVAQDRQKRNYDRRRIHQEFHIGDRVWLRLRPLSSADHNQIAKFMPKWRGPCRIILKLSPLVYELQEEETGALLGSHNIVDLKKFLGRKGEVYKLQDQDLLEEPPAEVEEWEEGSATNEKSAMDEGDLIYPIEGEFHEIVVDPEVDEWSEPEVEEFPEAVDEVDHGDNPRRSQRNVARVDYRRLAGLKPGRHN